MTWPERTRRRFGPAAALAALVLFAFDPNFTAHGRYVTNDVLVSLTMFAIMVSGVALWLIYGAFVHDIPIMVANGATLLLAGTVLALKIRNG